jgi:formamidopyrimidine-DNA glycosylase
MPELPEVEVLVRHLDPLLRGTRITGVEVRRAKVVRPSTAAEFTAGVQGARLAGVRRRGKYLVFALRRAASRAEFRLVGHLGMTGRIHVQAAGAPLPKHTAVRLVLGSRCLVFEDTRYFGRLTLDTAVLDRLGPEPLTDDFRAATLRAQLRHSRQPIKVRLLDQSLVAGVGNVYASEALFRAGISPRTAARRLRGVQVARLVEAIREVLLEAIRFGSTVPLDWAGQGQRDGLFYYGRAPGAPDYYAERLAVYDRAGLPCRHCGTPIHRLVQAARSTFFCARCQRSGMVNPRATC